MFGSVAFLSFQSLPKAKSRNPSSHVPAKRRRIAHCNRVVAESLESRLLLSATLTQLAIFDGTNCGSDPVGDLVADRSGDLYGVTYDGGAGGDGTIFELAKGCSTITTLYSFGGGTDGANPAGGLVLDASGEYLYGTARNGGQYGYGTLFKYSLATEQMFTLYSFGDGADDPESPIGTLTFDASGNLYGATSFGGAGSEGAVFEFSPGESALTMVASFTGLGAIGALPNGGLIFDSAGNLYGTTEYDGASPQGYGTIFEIQAGTSAPTTLYSFSGNNTGAWPAAGVGLAWAGAGILAGTTTGGGGGGGMVFEFDTATSTFQTLVGLGAANGCYDPEGTLLADANDDLYGTTSGDHSGPYGTVFETTTSPNTLTTLITFPDSADGGDGEYPEGGLISDADGNLYGTTGGDNIDYNGTIFEISGTGFAVPVATTTAVTCSSGIANNGQAVTFTATVTPSSGSGETGTVQFQIDGGNVGTAVTLSGNTATYAMSTLSDGNHSIVAVYSGDGNFTTSTSPAFNQTIVPAWLAVSSTATWNAGNQTLTITGNATIIGNPVKFGDTPMILDSSTAGNLTVDTLVADGGDGDAIVYVAAISGNGITTVNAGSSLDIGSFTQATLLNNGTAEIDGNGNVSQLTGSGDMTIGNGSSTNTLTLATQTTPGILSGGFSDTQGSVTIEPGSTLDITNNVLLLDYGSGSSPLAAVATAVAWGAGKGSNANGAIISSTVNSSAAGKYAIGYADHTEISKVPTGNVEVAYTLAGDATVDSSVDILDYQQMAPRYDEAGTYDWSQGDFNRDSHVDILDYQAMAPNYDRKLTGTDQVTTEAVTSGNDLALADSSPTVTYILSINDDGTGSYAANQYAIYAVDSSSGSNLGIANFSVNFTGFNNITGVDTPYLAAPVGSYDTVTGSGSHKTTTWFTVGFSVSNHLTANGFTGAQDTSDYRDGGGNGTNASEGIILAYGVGQTAGNLTSLAASALGANYQGESDQDQTPQTFGQTIGNYANAVLLVQGDYNTGSTPAFTSDTTYDTAEVFTDTSGDISGLVSTTEVTQTLGGGASAFVPVRAAPTAAATPARVTSGSVVTTAGVLQTTATTASKRSASVATPTPVVQTIADSAIGSDGLYLGISYQPVFAD